MRQTGLARTTSSQKARAAVRQLRQASGIRKEFTEAAVLAAQSSRAAVATLVDVMQNSHLGAVRVKAATAVLAFADATRSVSDEDIERDVSLEERYEIACRTMKVLEYELSKQKALPPAEDSGVTVIDAVMELEE